MKTENEKIINTVSEEITLKERYTQAIRNHAINNTKSLLSKDGNEIRAGLLLDNVSLEASLGVVVVLADGRTSDIKPIKKSSLTKQGCFNFLLDSIANFSQEDISSVFKAVIELRNKNFEGLPQIDSSCKEGLDTVYMELCIYCAKNAKADEIFMKDGYWNVLPSRFKQIVTEIDGGYSPLAIKKLFKALGFLRVNGGRNYDYAINLNPNENKTVRFISFKLPSEVSAS